MTNAPARTSGKAPAGSGTAASAGEAPYSPPPLTTLEDTGLSPLWLQDLALKVMYFQGYLTGYKIAEEVALPFSGVIDQILDTLKREKLIEVRSSQMGLGEGAYLYAITGAGIARAREALDRSQYAGPAPVPLNVYINSILRQARGRMTVTNRIMRQVLSNLVLSENTFQSSARRSIRAPPSSSTARPATARPAWRGPSAT